MPYIASLVLACFIMRNSNCFISHYWTCVMVPKLYHSSRSVVFCRLIAILMPNLWLCFWVNILLVKQHSSSICSEVVTQASYYFLCLCVHAQSYYICQYKTYNVSVSVCCHLLQVLTLDLSLQQTDLLSLW